MPKKLRAYRRTRSSLPPRVRPEAAILSRVAGDLARKVEPMTHNHRLAVYQRQNGTAARSGSLTRRLTAAQATRALKKLHRIWSQEDKK